MLLSTFESKKELLLSLAPSLQVAEKLRKDEEEERQAFTRCKVEKSSKKHSFYEYIDIDTKMTIRPEDYEMRYVCVYMYLYVFMYVLCCIRVSILYTIYILCVLCIIYAYDIYSFSVIIYVILIYYIYIYVDT